MRRPSGRRLCQFQSDWQFISAGLDIWESWKGEMWAHTLSYCQRTAGQNLHFKLHTPVPIFLCLLADDFACAGDSFGSATDAFAFELLHKIGVFMHMIVGLQVWHSCGEQSSSQIPC